MKSCYQHINSLKLRKLKEQKNLEQATTAQETSPPQQTTATEVKTVNPTEVVQQNVAPTKESGLKELIEMNPFEYVTVPAVLERITLSEPER